MAHAESNAGGEERWIEAEAMSDNEDELGGLFADPDPLDTFRFDFGGHHLVLSGYKAELGQTLNSTGLTLWRASEILCQYMVEHPILIENETVLELGAGLGLCGILAYHLQAKHVVLTDGDSDALDNLRQNITHNVGTDDARIRSHQLVWGRHVESFRSRFGRFSTIIGSDIIYVEGILEPLWTTVDALLEPKGTFLLAYARRNVKMDLVLEYAQRFEFEWTCCATAEGVYVFRKRLKESTKPSDA